MIAEFGRLKMEKKGPLKISIPAQGSKQFLTARKEMLNAFDEARDKSRKHKVETYHGKVAEAVFREWLSNFLPKRYAVTSGYIISQGVEDTQKTPHFDVIIYDHLESPILWIEDSPDFSQRGRSLAIPAEHVKGVIEVKSSFSNSSVKEAIEHLSDMQHLMQGLDKPGERYKLYFPPDFFCAIVFFELQKSNVRNRKALNRIVEGIGLRGFRGGLILRGEGHAKELTGKIDLVHSETPMESDLRHKERTLLSGFAMADSMKIKDDLHFGAILMWNEPNFSQFAFDLVAYLQGTYEMGKVSSFHALGTTKLAEAKRKEAQQSAVADPGTASLNPGG